VAALRLRRRSDTGELAVTDQPPVLTVNPAGSPKITQEHATGLSDQNPQKTAGRDKGEVMESTSVDPRVARVDASYVLDWLRQTNAPANIIGLQERIVESLGGYVGFPERLA
jgi:hypothetical protein